MSPKGNMMGGDHTIKVFWNKYYQLLPSTQIQQNAIKGIFNASLFSLGNYCSANAIYSQRNGKCLLLPSSCLTGIESRERRMLNQLPWVLVMGFKSHPHGISAEPQQEWEPSMYFCWAHQLEEWFHLSSPLLLGKSQSESTLLKRILHATFALGAHLSPQRIAAL